MISLAKAAKTSMRRMVRRDKTSKRPAAEASSNNDAPNVFARFKRSTAKKAPNTNNRLVPDAATTTLPVTTTAPVAPARSPSKGMRTAVNKIKQHVSDTLDRLLTSLRGAQKDLSDNVAKSVKLQQQAEQFNEFVEAAEVAAARAREQAATAAAAVGVLEHIEQQLLDKVRELQKPLGGSAELQDIERNLKLQHEAVLQQKTAVMKWYSNAAEAQAVQERASEVVGAAREEYAAAQRDLAAAAAALYEAQRATLAARQMIIQAVTRAHLDDLRQETGESLEEEQLVLAERENDVVVVGHVSLSEKLRMEQGEIWQEIPAELADVYGHTAVSAQRADYEQAKEAAEEATKEREIIAQLAAEIAAMADASSAPLYILTSQALQRQVDEETLHKEEAENRVRYLLTRLNWVRLAAVRGAADDHPWIANTQLPQFEVDSDPSVVEAIEQLNIAKADLLAVERKLARLESVAKLQASYASLTGKNVAAGESVTVTATQLMKLSVLAEIRAYRHAKYVQQSVQEACEAVQLGMRQANGEQATPERSLSRIGLEPKRLQYFMQYYLDTLPKRLTTRPRPTTPVPAEKARSPPQTPRSIPPPSFTADPTPLSPVTPEPTPLTVNGVRGTAAGKAAEPDADIARVRAALQGFLGKGQVASSASSSAARPSSSFSPPDFDRPGRLGDSRQQHPLAGTSLEVSAAKTLKEAVELDSALLDSVRSRLALAQLLERADNKVVRELVNSQFAADVQVENAVVVEPAPVKAVEVEVAEEPDVQVPPEDALERVRHFYALQYMLERASNTATASPASPTPAPVASFALSYISDDDSSSVASRRSSLDQDSSANIGFSPPTSSVDDAPPAVPASQTEEEVAEQQEVTSEQEVALMEEEVPAVEEEEEVPAPEPVVPEPVLVAAVVAEAPILVEVASNEGVADVPAPAEMASALATALVEETTVSPAGNLVKKGPKKVKKSAVIKMRTFSLPAMPKLEFTPPTWGEISKIMQEKGELTGSLLALSIASWGGIVATHMDSAAVISTVYMAAGVSAMSAVNRQTAVVAAREAALAAEREAAERAERERAEREAERAAAEAAMLAAARAAAEREAAEKAAAEAAAQAAALAAAEAAAQASVVAAQQPAAEAVTFVSKMWKSFKKSLSPSSKGKAAAAEAAPAPVVVAPEPAAAVVADEPASTAAPLPSPVKVATVMTTAVYEEDISQYGTPVSALSAATSLDAASLQTAESVLEEEAEVKGSMWQRSKAWFTRVNNRRPELTGSVMAIALGSLGCFSANVVH